MAFFYTVSLMLDIADAGLGEAVFATYVALFFMTPVLVAFLMRFSLFKWYVDPIAAAVIPLFLYSSMIINTVRRSDRGFGSAFLAVNRKLAYDGGAGFIFLIYLIRRFLVARSGTMLQSSISHTWYVTPKSFATFADSFALFAVVSSGVMI